MSKHRNPRLRLPKRPSPDNFDPGVLIALLYDDLVEVEALAVTADEAVTEFDLHEAAARGHLGNVGTTTSSRSSRAVPYPS